jgi:phosphoribosylamine-glycine ligase
VAIFCPTRDAMKIERDRDFARQLCHRFKIPFPEAYVAGNAWKRKQSFSATRNRLFSRIHFVFAYQPDSYDPLRNPR